MSRVVTVGADPEIGICGIGRSSNGGIVPVCGLMGGDKGAPIVQGEEGGWLEDGVTLELNPTPHTDPGTVQGYMHTLIKKANEKLADQTLRTYYPLEQWTFKEAQLKPFEKANTFGCSEDFSAYQPDVARQDVMQKAMKRFGETTRFYGGHIHVGVTDWPEALPKFIAVKLFDLFFGMPFLREYSGDTSSRGQVFGQAGIFRETKYGFEYRSPSNHWVNEDADRAHSLTRAKGVGEIFAEFEKYNDPLVALYNKVNWSDFEEAYNERNHGDMQRIVDRLCCKRKDPYTNYPLIEIGDKYVSAMHITSPVMNDEFLSKQEGNNKVSPAKKGIFDWAREIEQVENAQRVYGNLEEAAAAAAAAPGAMRNRAATYRQRLTIMIANAKEWVSERHDEGEITDEDRATLIITINERYARLFRDAEAAARIGRDTPSPFTITAANGAQYLVRHAG